MRILSTFFYDSVIFVNKSKFDLSSIEQFSRNLFNTSISLKLDQMSFLNGY
jgi:hypothetical protein